MIDPALYRRLFDGLAAIGREAGGWNRLAWGPGEDAARAWFRAEAEALGLTVMQDPAGSLWAVEPGGEDGPWSASGSHVDTVDDGGAYDGALGVVCGLVAVDALRRAGGGRRPLAVGCLVDEEGPRFGTAIFGSRALCGELAEAVLQRVDRDGLRLGDLAAARGVTESTLREAPAWRVRLGTWIEVHVEQGRRLVDVPAPLGVATLLAPRERWTVTVLGAADHAGTAPMEGRDDALVTAARAVLMADAAARGTPGAVATVGRIAALPGSTNVIPGEAVFSLDVRAADAEALARVRDVVREASGPTARWRLDSSDAGSAFDARLRDALFAAAAAEGCEAVDLAAYAGHDAGVLARHLPAAMLFVRNPTGISHNPAETASDEDCLAACAVLARALAVA